MRYYEFAYGIKLPYGYWISPTGEMFEVSSLNHDGVIADHGLAADDAVSAGWIRLACPPAREHTIWHLEVGRGLDKIAIAACRDKMRMAPRGAALDVHTKDEKDEGHLWSYATENVDQTILLVNAYRRGVLIDNPDFERFFVG